MTKKKKIIIICSILFVISLFVFELISFKKTVHEEHGIKIEMTVTKFLFFVHVNAKITNLSNRTIVHEMQRYCDNRPLNVSGNLAFTKTYKKLTPNKGDDCKWGLVNLTPLKPNESFQRNDNFFKFGFSTEPIFIIASFDGWTVENSKTKSNSNRNYIRKPLSTQAMIRFLQ